MCGRRPGQDRRRAARAAAGRRPRRGRELPRLRHPGDPRAHARRGLPRGRRDGRSSRATGSRSSTLDGAPVERAGRADRLGPGRGREGRLPALHAQGDPRAAARGRRHACRPDLARPGRGRRRTRRAPADRRRPARRSSASTSSPAAPPGTPRWSASSSSSGWRGIPVEVDYACEFRYRDPIVDARHLLIAIVTQSGETADTLAALREAKARGARGRSRSATWSARPPRARPTATIYTHAGPEIGVASTKAFTAQLTALYLLALRLGAARGVLGPRRRAQRADRRPRPPAVAWSSETLELDERDRGAWRETLRGRRDFLYLGRGINYPIALEGALKLKEISYIHAEGYPAGEMKHGPIALIDEQLPVVVLAPQDAVYEKMLSNMEEVKARGGTRDRRHHRGRREDLAGKADARPDRAAGRTELSTPILLVIPLQLLAYHIARAPRLRRRPAAQPGQERHRRMTPGPGRPWSPRPAPP